MKKFITTYKWICLPVVLSSAAVLSSSVFAGPTTSQQYKDGQQTSRINQQYIGGNTQIGAGITDQGNIDVQLNQVLSESRNRSISGGIWAEYDLKGDTNGDNKGFQGRGVEINHNWVSRDDNGQARRINKAKAAYDRNASGHEKVTVGYGQETENMFWDGRVSKGLSGRKGIRGTGADKISDRAYEYGVGASIGTFLPNSNLRVRGGLDHEWSDKVGNNEKDARNTTLSAGVEKFFEGSGHSMSLDVSGSKRSGGYKDGGSSDNDYSARLGYKYDFAGSSAFQNATSTKRIRVEVPGNAVVPKYESQTLTKRVATYKTVPVYGKKSVKVPYKRMVKSTMALEGQTFFKLNSAKLIPSAKQRLSQVASQIRKSGYKGSIRITGNTCGLGNAQYDQILSERRAKSVRNFLIQQGFNPDHLMARGLGKSHPKFRNVPGEGFKNRRVDIEYVTETSVAKTAYRTEEKTVQTGTRKVATGFQNVPAGTKNVMIDNGQAGAPRVIWKTETVNNPPAWIQRALHNNIKHDRSINTYQTTEGFDTQPLNIVPVAADDTAKTACGLPVTINVLGNDSDINNNTLSVLSFTQGANGTVTRGDNGQLIYTSNSADCGENDEFTYTVSDGNGGTDTAKVTVTVDPDDKVVASNETTSVESGQAITIDVLDNDDSDAMINKIVSNPANGTVEIVNGKIIYKANPGFSGTDTFIYEVIDVKGNVDTATVTVNVAATSNNTAPVAKNDLGNVVCSGPVTINVLENDRDADTSLNNLSILEFSQPTNGTVTKIANGQLVYASNGNSCGTNDTFTYSITDGVNTSNTATVTIAIAPAINKAPTAVDDAVTTQVNTPITIMTVANDSDPDGDNLLITDAGQPQSGTVTTDGIKIIYTPKLDFVGVDIFDYTISDGNGGTSMATETVTVTAAPNTKPVANDDKATTAEETPITLMTVANDTDPDGDELTITNITQPANGEATSDGKKITYTPKIGFTGEDKLTYVISDGRGGTATATEFITVTAKPNTKPIAKNDSVKTTEATPVILNTVANDTDADGDNLTITNVQQPDNGTVSDDGKKITYTPKAGFVGTDKFTYTITDGNGGNATATETVIVEAAVNKAPTANLDSMTTGCAIITINVLANDSDPENDTLTITNVSGSNLGTTKVVGNKIEFKPSNTCDKGNTGTDTLSYTISDGVNTATGNVKVEVLGDVGNTKAEYDFVTTKVNKPISINVLANDSGIGLKITIIGNPKHGTYTESNGVITYTPNLDYEGKDEFYYDIEDQNGYKDYAIIDVLVEKPCPEGQKCN